jgi:hypothetical protein
LALFVAASELNTKKRMSTQLRLPNGAPDIDAIVSVMGDWFVPLLVKEFIAGCNAASASIELLQPRGTVKVARKRS